MNRDHIQEKIDSKRLEEGDEILLDFKKLQKVAQSEDPVIPAVAQDVDSKEVLIVGYANEKALRHTLETQKATFWSTSRNELWLKGLTSGDVLELVEIRVNCEQNSLLYLVRMVGKGSCHTKDKEGKTRFGCYYRKIQDGKLVFTENQG